MSHKDGFDKKGLTFRLIDHWRAGRPNQTCDYFDVVSEVDRRADGEYVLTPKERDKARSDALRQVEVQFKLSALLADFMITEDLTTEQLAEITFVDVGEIQNLLDPIVGGKSDGLENNTFIDAVYPGKARKVVR